MGQSTTVVTDEPWTETVKEQPPVSGSLVQPQSDPAHDLQLWKAAEPTVSPLAFKSLPAALTP